MALIELRGVTKVYEGAAGGHPALRGIDLDVEAGHLVAVVGKSGSGKSTLINVVTGIDRPTAGEVRVGGTAVHALGENALARWRGRELGVVFQFFQLLPTLTLAENVMLPMDFCGTYPAAERRARALGLLGRVGMAEAADKLPSAVSGGQQQRVAIARALANDPPLIVADEPTGNLDSRTADAVFALFAELVHAGKTVVMVTHDRDLAARADRSVVVADGEIVDRHVAGALGALDVEQLALVARRFERLRYAPGAVVVRQGEPADRFYVVGRGEVEVSIERADRGPTTVNRLGAGQYFGEAALLAGTPRTATVRAAGEDVELLALDAETFRALIAGSDPTRRALEGTMRERLARDAAVVA